MTEPKNQEKVLAMVQEVYGEGSLEEEAIWQAVVLITKGGGYYRVIGLVECGI